MNFFFIITIYSVYAYLIYLFFYYYKKRDMGKLVHLLITSVFGIIFVNILKYSINRPRPYVIDQGVKNILKKADPSFPSAHTTISFLSFYFLPESLSKLLRRLLSFYLLFLIPFGSMYIGIHYPSDILVGSAIGFLFPRIISEKTSEKLAKRFFK
jgi:undecaprenyl-diphosphatase